MTATLLGLLQRAQQLGFIGPGDLVPHLEHSQGFVDVLADAAPGLVVDLGSGGGLPALVVIERTSRPVLMVESQARRAAFLAEAVQELDGEDRVEVVHDRAEVVAATRRGAAAAVTARAFGPPGTTAEIAAPFLAVGGRLIVSEPPGLPALDRWPAPGLAELGMKLDARVERGSGALQVIRQVDPAPQRYPRRVGVATKRPIF